MSPNAKGAILMMLSMAAFTLNDTAIKAIDGAIPLFQLLTMRGVLVTGMLLMLTVWFGTLKLTMTNRDAVFVVLRSLSEVGAAYFIISALWVMPLATISSILQMLPLTVTLCAVFLFQEKVGWRRMTAIAFGFVGMLLIIRPWTEGLDSFVLFGIACVVCVTLRDVLTRYISADVPSLMVTLYVSVGVLGFFAVASATEPYVAVSREDLVLLAGSAVFIMGGYLFSVMVMRVGEISFAAPFRYSGLIWALILGWLLFGEWPDPLTLLGAAIVVGSGLFTLFRGQALNRAN